MKSAIGKVFITLGKWEMYLFGYQKRESETLLPVFHVMDRPIL